MLVQYFNLVFIKSFALQFFDYTVLTLAFFSFFVLVSNLMNRAKKIKNTEVKIMRRKVTRLNSKSL